MPTLSDLAKLGRFGFGTQPVTGGVKNQPGFGYAGNAGGGMTTGGLDPVASGNKGGFQPPRIPGFPDVPQPFGANNPKPGTPAWFQSPNGIAQAGATNDRARWATNPLVAGAMGTMGANVRANPDYQKSQDWFNKEVEAMNRPDSYYAGPPKALKLGTAFNPATGTYDYSGPRDTRTWQEIAASQPTYNAGDSSQVQIQKWLDSLPPALRAQVLALRQGGGM